jgi:hypothetical protein
VLWRGLPNSPDGHVTVTMTTPATTGHPLTTKITRTKHPPDAEYKSPPPPNAFTNERGMWVVGHENYTRQVNVSTQRSRRGRPGTVIPRPQLVWVADSTAVVRVSPAEWEGGVLAGGRAYTP